MESRQQFATFAKTSAIEGAVSAIGGKVLGGLMKMASRIPVVGGILGRLGMGGRGLAANNTGNLFTYTRRPGGFAGGIFNVGAAGRAFTTKHAPGAWAFDGGIKNALTRAWRTGQFTKFSYVKKIPDSARHLFSPVLAFGPARGWKRLGGQHFTRTPGNVNLATGEVLSPTFWQRGRFVADAAIYHGVDITVTGSAIGLGGYRIYNFLNDE